MYKIEIEIGDYAWSMDEKITIETNNFDKIAVIQKFIEFQQDNGWSAECVEINDLGCDQCDEEYNIGDWYYDEDGSVWEKIM